MKISKARAWVENTYTEEDLEKLKKPIYRTRLLGYIGDFLLEDSDTPLSAYIEKISAFAAEYPTAYVSATQCWDASEISIKVEEVVRHETVTEVAERLAKDYQRGQTAFEQAQARKKKAEERAKSLEEQERILLKKLKEKYE